MSTPSFNSILTQNQLVKGRIQLSSKDLDKLYRSIIKQCEKTQKRLEKQREKVQLHMSRICELKLELKRNTETLQKAFYPSNINISLLFKKLGQQYYIKARFYWHGQQREVQVGSIPIVMSLLKTMQDNGELEEYKLPKSRKLTWDQIKANDSLMAAIKAIAALKFQEYIIRKLMIEETSHKEIDEVERKEVVKIKEVQEEMETIEKIDEEINEYSNGDQTDWYVQWRENNLK